MTLLPRAGADGAVPAGMWDGLQYSSIRGRIFFPLEFFSLLH